MISVSESVDPGSNPVTVTCAVNFFHLDPEPCASQAGPCCLLPGGIDVFYPGPANGRPVTQAGGDIVVTDTSDTPARTLGALRFVQKSGAESLYGTVGTQYDPDAGWTAGDRLSVTAPNGAGGLESFGGSITTLPLIDGIAPVQVVDMTLPTSGDFRVTWTPDPQPQSGETMLVALNGTGGYVACTAPDGDGSLTVPGSFVSQLKPNMDNGSIVFYRTLLIAATSSTPGMRSTTSRFFALLSQ